MLLKEPNCYLFEQYSRKKYGNKSSFQKQEQRELDQVKDLIGE